MDLVYINICNLIGCTYMLKQTAWLLLHGETTAIKQVGTGFDLHFQSGQETFRTKRHMDGLIKSGSLCVFGNRKVPNTI